MSGLELASGKMLSIVSLMGHGDIPTSVMAINAGANSIHFACSSPH
jgi:FixJ family two-component response regulator